MTFAFEASSESSRRAKKSSILTFAVTFVDRLGTGPTDERFKISVAAEMRALAGAFGFTQTSKSVLNAVAAATSKRDLISVVISLDTRCAQQECGGPLRVFNRVGVAGAQCGLPGIVRAAQLKDGGHECCFAGVVQIGEG